MTQARKEYIRKIYGEKLHAKLLSADRFEVSNMIVMDSIDKVIDYIISVDPTSNHKYSLWLTKLYINGLKFEDLYKAKEYLTTFATFSSKLPQRDISQYKTLAELLNAVEPFMDKKTNRQIRFDQKAKIFENIEIVYDGPYGKIFIPKNVEAARFLGQNTQWCTAAAEDDYNAFEDYNCYGPLFVIVNRTGTRYQFHFESGQFCNVRDEEISHINWIKQNRRLANILGKYGLEKELIINNDYITDFWIYFIDEKDVSDETKIKLIVEDNQCALKFKRISDNVLTAVLWDSKDHHILGLLPERLKSLMTEELQRHIVKQNPYSLNLLFKIGPVSDSVIKSALRKNGAMLAQVHNPTYEMKRIAIIKTPKSIEYIINPTVKLQRLAVAIEPAALWGIKNPDFDLVIELMEKNERYIKFVNPSSGVPLDMNYGIMGKVISKFPSAIAHVSQTEVLCRIAVEANPNAIQAIHYPSTKIINLYEK